jgi:hypothetical protein
MTTEPMSRAEREDLRRLCRYQATLATTGAAQRAAELRADFEEQLASIFRFDDDAIWKAATEAADEAVDEADERIAARCKELRIPDIDNWCVKTQAALIKVSPTSAQAAAFLEQMPTAEQLMPTLDASRIASLLPGGNLLIEGPGDDDQ